MIRSMTGYGQGSAEAPGFRARAEIRCVNNRFADLRLRLPAELLPREADLRARVLARVRRGRVEVDVRIEGDRASSPLVLNRALARAVAGAAKELREEFGAAGEVGVSDLLQVPGMLQASSGESGLDEERAGAVERAVDAALAMGMAIAAADAAGLGTCPISYVRSHIEKVGPLFGLPEGERTDDAETEVPRRCRREVEVASCLSC